MLPNSGDIPDNNIELKRARRKREEKEYRDYITHVYHLAFIVYVCVLFPSYLMAFSLYVMAFFVIHQSEIACQFFYTLYLLCSS